MLKKLFSSADLSADLSSRARHDLWRDIHFAEVSACDVDVSDRPFEATLEAAEIGEIVFAKMSGTVNRVARRPHNIRNDPLDQVMLVMNLGPSMIGGTYMSKELELGTGSALLDGKDVQQFTGGDTNVWANLAMPRKLLTDSFSGIEDKHGIAIQASNPSLGLLRNYLGMLTGTDLPAGSPLTDHVSSTIIDLIGLAIGAKGDEAELAGLGGLRAARLQTVLGQIRKNYRNPALSAPLIGLQLGLTPRYINELLAATGSSFSERLLELRLQDAKAMLTNPTRYNRRIVDVAYEVGFSDISYFNRCFKRRFGCSPTAAR